MRKGDTVSLPGPKSVDPALTNGKWVEDIQAALSARGEVSIETVMEFPILWNLIEEVELLEDEADIHTWRLSTSGQYTTKSAYDALFEGAARFEPY
nr:unnamed protein product [Digitaria exilis]